MKGAKAADLEVLFFENGLKRRASQLADSMRRLADDLARAASELDREGATATVNSLGVVQGIGASIDRETGELCAMRNLLAAMKRALEYAREGD